MKLADRAHCHEANGHTATTNGMGDRLNIFRALDEANGSWRIPHNHVSDRGARAASPWDNRSNARLD